MTQALEHDAGCPNPVSEEGGSESTAAQGLGLGRP